MLGSFLIKLQAFIPVTFLKRDSNTSVSCGYCEILKNSFFYRTHLVAASDSPTTGQESQLVCLTFVFVPPRGFNFYKNLTQNVAQMILY